MSQSLFPISRQLGPFGPIRVLVVFSLELALIHFTRHSFGFECYRNSTAFCSVARNALLASYGLAAVLVLLGLFDRRAFLRLLSYSDVRPGPFLMNLTGLGTLIATLPLLQMDLTTGAFTALGLLWGCAIGFLVLGTILMIGPFRAWGQLLRRLGWATPFVVIAGASGPFIAIRLRPIWEAEVLASFTFDATTWLLATWGTQVESFPDTRIIGADDFFVSIAASCSGIEGLVLTTTFAVIYLVLFRSNLRFPQALFILPVALLASWALNVFRIALLVQIGISGFPALAVGGFHSHAGWLMFTVLSLGIVMAAQAIPLFHKPVEDTDTAPAALPPFFSDPVVAQILPFVIFMASALLASTFAHDPILAYPARAIAMGAVLTLFWPYLSTLPWRIDGVSVLAGIAIAVLWIVTASEPETVPAVAQLGGFAALLWVVARCLGTTVFVPIIEELFFRGYLLDRIAPLGSAPLRTAIGVVITSGAFALLHDRWIEAALAGVVFAALTLRSRNLTDAIIAHAVANGLIAAWALTTGNWAMV